LKNTKKLGLPISSKTGEPLKPFIKPRKELLRGIIFIALIFIFSSIAGCLFIFRAKLGNKHALAHQIIVLISDLFVIFMGFVFSIILWSIPGILGMVEGIIIIIVSTLGSIIHCLYWLVKLEKYKVKN